MDDERETGDDGVEVCVWMDVDAIVSESLGGGMSRERKRRLRADI